MNINLINAFLAKDPESESEHLLRNNAINLNAALTKVIAEREELLKSLRSKEEDVLRLSGALENQLVIIENLATAKGLQPLETTPSDAETSADVTETVTPSPA